MKANIHPTWYPNATIVCMSCGTSWRTGATVESLRTDICSNCHPFYTGEQRIVDTEGQVDRFMKRLQNRDARMAEKQAREEAKLPQNIALTELQGIPARYLKLLEENEIKTAGDFISKLEAGGDSAILDIDGIGRKVLTDVKRALRGMGFELPKSGDSDAAEA
jgi:large subunit ribosomal protein L31